MVWLMMRRAARSIGDRRRRTFRCRTSGSGSDLNDGPGHLARRHPRRDPRPRRCGLPGTSLRVRAQGPEVNSSAEAICRLYDDFDLAGFLAQKRQRHWLPAAEHAALAAFDSCPWRLYRDRRRRSAAMPPGLPHPMARHAQACAQDARNLREATGCAVAASLFQHEGCGTPEDEATPYTERGGNDWKAQDIRHRSVN